MAQPERRADDDQPTLAGGAAALRTPGESSSSDIKPPSDAPTLVDVGGLSAGSSPPPRLTPPSRKATHVTSDAGPILQPGSLLGQRYEILALLGQGGMGAVYKARDLEVNQLVALKVIRPDLASNPAIIERFKQELILARQVTHKNVIRIYDLAEADGVKFITMEFVEGADLRTLIHEKKKVSPEESVEIMRQVCRALEAAHGVDVIHRDLKPQNIMRDNTGRVLVMDFGLARTLEGTGMTQTGAMVGTLEYMSPEQALGKNLDQRSDLFTVGLIFYELLTGKMPFCADSALASLIKRTQERAAPVSDEDSSIPGALTGIVSKCLERDASLRYQSATELLADLERWQGKRAAATLTFPAVGTWGKGVWQWISVAVVVVTLATLGIRYRGVLFPSKPAQVAVKPDVSLAILPFRNASADSALDWLGPSLSDMLSTDVGQSARLRTISPDRLHQVLSDLQITANVVVDPTMLRRIAEFSGADTIVWGQYAKFGDTIRIDATLQDLKHDRRVPLKVEVATEKDVPGGVDKLAGLVRENLAVSADVVRELQATSFQPTSKSLPALRDYNQGVQLLRDGKNLEAQKVLKASTKEDPAFGLAFSKLAQTYSNLGYDSEAEQAAQNAVSLSENLPQAEKYLIAAIRAQVANNFPEAIKAYENLAKAAPDNADVQSALARLYEDTGDFAKADEHYQKLLSANPNDVAALVFKGRLAIRKGNAQDGLDALNHALTLSVQLNNQEQKAAALHYMGTAYRLLNKPDEALRNYKEALTIRRDIGQKRGIASSLNEMARTEALLGNQKQAAADFQEALKLRREIGDKRGLGDTLIDLANFLDDGGDRDQALKMYKEALQIKRDLGNESAQAVCLNNIGAVYFEKAQYEDARTYYQQALQLREKLNVPQDIVESVHNLAETSARMGEYDQAVSQYMRALEVRHSMSDSRGAAMESYMLGTVFDNQGRFGAAVNSKQEAFKTFQDLKDRTYWMADIESGYAEGLILAGRGDEAKKYLDEALGLAHELKNDGMVSQVLAFQGDAAYYRGDSKSARSLYEQALQAGTRGKEPYKVLMAKVALSRIALQEGRGPQIIASLRQLVQQADEQGVPNVSVECAIYVAQAMIQSHDNAHAQQELERALLRADKLGLKPLSAQAHYLLANALSASGNQTEAQPHYRNALQLLDGMRQEPGAEKILNRSDFKTIHDEASRSAQTAKN